MARVAHAPSAGAPEDVADPAQLVSERIRHGRVEARVEGGQRGAQPAEHQAQLVQRVGEVGARQRVESVEVGGQGGEMPGEELVLGGACGNTGTVAGRSLGVDLHETTELGRRGRLVGSLLAQARAERLEQTRSRRVHLHLPLAPGVLLVAVGSGARRYDAVVADLGKDRLVGLHEGGHGPLGHHGGDGCQRSVAHHALDHAP